MMMTIEEYKYEHNVTNRELAELLDVPYNRMLRYIEGFAVKPEVLKRMHKLGITHPVKYNKTQSKKQAPKKVKFESDILTEFQVAIVEHYGNTIVSKAHGREAIIKEFERFGINVKVRDFYDKIDSEDTHYVVAKIESK